MNPSRNILPTRENTLDFTGFPQAYYYHIISFIHPIPLLGTEIASLKWLNSSLGIFKDAILNFELGKVDVKSLT